MLLHIDEAFPRALLTSAKATAGGLLGGMIFTQRKHSALPYVFRNVLIFAALILAIAYTYAQENKGKKVSFFIVTFNVVWLPWVMLLMTLVMAGPGAVLQQATGIVAAHLYDFLTRLWPTFGGGRNYIITPAIVKQWFGADRPNIQARGYGTAYRQAVPAPGRGTSSGFGFSSAWGTRGQGRRLGGD